MKISMAGISTAAVCDLHPSLALARVGATIVLQGDLPGDDGTWTAIPCQDPNCNRFYSPYRGYFYARAGERPVVGFPKTLNCNCHSEPVFMYLMTTEKELMWACPECAATQPYMAEAHAS
jgi:hypothetical protein